MNRSKIVAIITGAISVLLAVAYLLLVTLLDFRGEMRPAPQSQLQPRVHHSLFVAQGSWFVAQGSSLNDDVGWIER